MKRFVMLVLIGFGFLFSGSIRAGEICEGKSTGFLAFGDFGMGNKTQKKVAEAMVSFCKTELCEFAVLLGDNIYPDGVDSARDPQWKKKFEEPYRMLAFDFYPTLGNHDYHGSIEAQIEYSDFNDKWKMPARYYSFKKCHVEFFVIDTEDFDRDQASWLQSKINKSKATWKIVYGHRPVFSHGGHGNSKMLQAELLPIIKKTTDFYLAGHDHHLEYITRDYMPHFIVSGSAAETRPVHPGKGTIFADSVTGFVHFQLDQNRGEIRFVNEKGDLVFEHLKAKSKKRKSH